MISSSKGLFEKFSFDFVILNTLMGFLVSSEYDLCVSNMKIAQQRIFTNLNSQSQFVYVDFILVFLTVFSPRRMLKIDVTINVTQFRLSLVNFPTRPGREEKKCQDCKIASCTIKKVLAGQKTTKIFKIRTLPRLCWYLRRNSPATNAFIEVTS